VKWKYCLTETSDRYVTTLTPYVGADLGFYIPFPKLFEWQLPRKSVHFLATTKPSFVYNPAERLQAVTNCILQETRRACTIKVLRSRLPGRHVDQSL